MPRKITGKKKPEVVADSRSVSELRDEAEMLISEFETDRALVLLEKALALAPEDTSVLDLMAQAYLDNGQADSAFTVLQSSISIAPDNGSTKWMYMGQLQSGLDAVECFKRGINLLFAERDEAKTVRSNRTTLLVVSCEKNPYLSRLHTKGVSSFSGD
jgi:hypothetical protein